MLCSLAICHGAWKRLACSDNNVVRWEGELIYIDCDSTAGAQNVEAKENVRRTVDAIATTDLEYGTGFNDYRELEEHGKLHCSCYHAIQLTY